MFLIFSTWNQNIYLSIHNFLEFREPCSHNFKTFFFSVLSFQKSLWLQDNVFKNNIRLGWKRCSSQVAPLVGALAILIRKLTDTSREQDALNIRSNFLIVHLLPSTKKKYLLQLRHLCVAAAILEKSCICPCIHGDKFRKVLPSETFSKSRFWKNINYKTIRLKLFARVDVKNLT